jgi:hypothetical protein
LVLPEWKSSKYVYVVSGLHASLFEIQAAIKKCLDTTDQLCQISAKMQGVDQLYCSGSASLDFEKQANLVCVVDSQSEQHVHTIATQITEIEGHILKQRTPSWHSARLAAKVTGSIAHTAMGLNTLKNHVSYFDQIFMGKEPPEISEMAKKCL